MQHFTASIFGKCDPEFTTRSSWLKTNPIRDTMKGKENGSFEIHPESCSDLIILAYLSTAISKNRGRHSRFGHVEAICSDTTCRPLKIRQNSSKDLLQRKLFWGYGLLILLFHCRMQYYVAASEE